MTRKRITWGIVLLISCLALIFGLYWYHIRNRAWYEKYPVICHALGRTQEGDTLTNSLEAFQYNYKRGQRVFEADVQITSDGKMVLRHDWVSGLGQEEAFGWTEEDSWAVTAEEFLSSPIYGKYTPLSLEDWFAIMREYPDIWFVTDTKYSSPFSFTNFIKSFSFLSPKDTKVPNISLSTMESFSSILTKPFLGA